MTGRQRRVIGNRLRALRGTRSQREVAAGVRVTERTLRLWEKGETVPQASHQQRLADYFEVSRLYLSTGRTAPGEEPKQPLSRGEREELIETVRDLLDRLEQGSDPPASAPRDGQGLEASRFAA